ncbi:heavy-metal-associated domain-containing protein [uncultured Microbacterium sp.]|uniref:heavy-metal-associated domain-containing protein n=1 Tax=uncultured Microbacterium sp. TaxID=191216 RepID=UPI00262837F8|nr:heavy-metal-associated domain-containing protein [uncultured Microbacterium sp.]
MSEQRIELGLTATTPARGGCGDGCGCAHGTAASAPASVAATDELRVEGMTCEHCVRAVTEELSSLEGVDVVDVALQAGGTSVVRIARAAGVSDDDVAAAIDEAGYSLAR